MSQVSCPHRKKKKKNNFTEMENGADKDEGQSRRRRKEAAPRNECQTTTGGEEAKMGKSASGGLFESGSFMLMGGPFLRSPLLFPCCCFPFFFAPLSRAPSTRSSLCAICHPSVSPGMLQMAFVKDVGDHRGFLAL